MPTWLKKRYKDIGAALEAKEGKIPMNKLNGKARRFYDLMSVEVLRERSRATLKGLRS